jgi:hypothetical protein
MAQMHQMSYGRRITSGEVKEVSVALKKPQVDGHSRHGPARQRPKEQADLSRGHMVVGDGSALRGSPRLRVTYAPSPLMLHIVIHLQRSVIRAVPPSPLRPAECGQPNGWKLPRRLRLGVGV